MENIKWFKEAKYGLMLHFGLYSMLGGVYKGKRSDYYSEWIQSYCAIPNAEMEKLAKNSVRIPVTSALRNRGMGSSPSFFICTPIVAHPVENGKYMRSNRVFLRREGLPSNLSCAIMKP